MRIYLILASLVFSSSFAQDCLDYGDYLHQVGLLDLSGTARDLAQSGDFVYRPLSTGSLQIVNVSDPENPFLLDDVPLQGSGDCLALSANLLLVGGNAGVLEIFDISNPGDPTPVSQWTMSYDVEDVVIQGDTAFLMSFGVLEALDLSLPSSPQLLCSVPLGGSSPGSMALDGNLLGLGSWDQAGYNYYEAYLDLYDVSDPQNLLWLSTFTLENATGSVPALQGDLALVAASSFLSGYGFFEIVDIQDPVQPISLAIFSSDDHREVEAIQFRGDLAFAAGPGFQIFDLVDPANPVLQARFNSGLAYALCGEGDFLSLSSSGGLLEVLDVSNPHNPPENWEFELYGMAGGMDYSQWLDFLLVCNGSYLTLVKTLNGQPLIERTIDVGGTVYDVAKIPDNDFAVAVNGDLSVEWVGVSDPGVTPGSLVTPSTDTCVEVQEFIAFTGATDGVYSYDVYSPDNPVYLGSDNTVGYIKDILVEGTGLLAATSNKIHLYSTANQGIPVHVDEYEIPGVPYYHTVKSLARLADFILAAVDRGTLGPLLCLLDYSNPLSPQLLSEFRVSGEEVWDLQVFGSSVYFLGDDLQVLDYSDPLDPRVLGFFPVAGDYGGLCVSEDEVFCTGWGATGQDETLIHALPLQCGETSVDPGTPSIFALTLSAWPNPFNPTVSLEVGMEASAEFRLAIYDLSGRELICLHEGSWDGGTLLWNGKDRRGRELPSGIYFARLNTSRASVSRKMVLLR